MSWVVPGGGQPALPCEEEEWGWLAGCSCGVTGRAEGRGGGTGVGGREAAVAVLSVANALPDKALGKPGVA